MGSADLSKGLRNTGNLLSWSNKLYWPVFYRRQQTNMSGHTTQPTRFLFSAAGQYPSQLKEYLVLVSMKKDTYLLKGHGTKRIENQRNQKENFLENNQWKRNLLYKK